MARGISTKRFEEVLRQINSALDAYRSDHSAAIAKAREDIGGPKSRSSSREVHEAADRACEKSRTILQENFASFQNLVPNPKSPAREWDASQIDTIISFIEANVVVFRLGYFKEQFVRKLKAAELSEAQRDRLIQVAINTVEGKYLGVGNREIARLMIRIGNPTFIRELKLLLKDDDELVTGRAGRMLKIVLNGRKDLAR